MIIITIKLTTSQAKEQYASFGLSLLESYVKMSNKHMCINEDGYLLCVALGNLKSGQGYSLFGKANIFTIYNIKLWLIKNNKNFKIHQDQTLCGTSVNMRWVCHIHGDFYATWENISHKDRKSTCPYCLGRKTHYNTCIATQHKQMFDYLKNKEDGYVFNPNSNKVLKMICPECGFEKNMRPNTFYRAGFGCGRCSDGISVPEKFMRNILIQSKIPFEVESKFDWSVKRKYDFYIPSMNMIIEVHGIQHYRYTGRGRSLEEEQNNDKLKEKLAKENGIKNYYVVDFRYSEYNWMVDNTIKTLYDVIKFDDVNFKVAWECSQKSKVVEAWGLWNNGLHSTKEISKIVGVNQTNACLYLKRGSLIDKCTYPNKIQVV